MSDVTYLITGSSGFVGGALARYLLRLVGTRVVALERDEQSPIGCDVVRGDVTDLRTLERAIAEHQPDVIFHLAAQAIVGTARRDPYGTMETNVRGTYAMLEAFRRQKKPGSRLIIASSDKAYGETRTDTDGMVLSYRENDPLEGRGIYDVSKSCCDLIAQSYAREYGLMVGIVRAGNIYGPGDRDMTRIIPSIMEDIRVGRDPIIMSDGSPVRDYLYIDDAVQAYMKVEEHLQYARDARAFNFAGGEPVSVLELVNLMLQITNKTYLKPKILGSRRDEIQHQVLNTADARAMGWIPRVNLHTGLMKTWVAT